MGDNGRLYQDFDRDYVEAMKDFCQQADVIIPNLTEAALLTGSPYLEEGSYDMTIIENLLRNLSRLGPRKVILTGISFETEKIGLAYFDKETNKVIYRMRKRYQSHFYGSGDLLTAILSAGYFHNLDFLKVCDLALDFLNKVLLFTLSSGRPLKYGLCYEPYIGYLFNGINELLEEKNDNTRELVELSLYAALIIVSVQFIRIPFGPQFVHLGNALVVIAVLIFGARKGALVATVGLGLFDIFNGYAAEVWITILESLIVCYVLYLVFEKLLKSNDKMTNIIIIGVIAAVTKIILNFVKYTIINSVVAALPLNAAMVLALTKIGGTFGTSVVTIIAVPLLYPVFKRILQRN